MGLPDLSVNGKVALVTGASSGLGQVAADCLIDAGAKVIGVARRADKLQEWQSKHGEDKAAIISADISNREVLKSIAEEAASFFGAPDILVNAAGINTREKADDVTFKGWDVTLGLNLSTPFFLAQYLTPAMRKKGWGRIINFASLQSRRAFAGGIAYGASKGGVEQLTRAMAEAWSKDGIMANAVAPGFFPSELTAPVFSDETLAQKNADQTCIGRNGMPDDLVGPLLFLASHASDYVTGQTLFVDGGFTAK
jgi:NAD(P)-dependent dehydrogenase (short-subunit alcohol dehydrogenase family)